MEEIKEAIICGVCKEIFDNDENVIPRMLPCKHTFCEKCLSVLMNQTLKQLRCPICRQVSTCMNGVNQAYPQDHTMMLLVKSIDYIQTLKQDSKTQDEELEKAIQSIIRKIDKLEKIKKTTQKNQSDLKAKLNTLKRDIYSAEMQSAQWQSQKLEDINHECENYTDILDQLDQLKERNSRSEGLNPHDIQLKARILKTVNHMQKENFKELEKTTKLVIAENRIVVINVPNYQLP